MLWAKDTGLRFGDVYAVCVAGGCSDVTLVSMLFLGNRVSEAVKSGTCCILPIIGVSTWKWNDQRESKTSYH